MKIIKDLITDVRTGVYGDYEGKEWQAYTAFTTGALLALAFTVGVFGLIGLAFMGLISLFTEIPEAAFIQYVAVGFLIFAVANTIRLWKNSK
jgi:hypothetical protein|tara:strand:+ start:305 stop:580 length:276 start_codon:yes stop_codon:yes gene_type:complete